MEALFKTAVLFGAVLLLGAGGFVRWVVPGRQGERQGKRQGGRLARGALLGSALLALGSLGELWVTLERIPGGLGSGLAMDYLLTTRHGQLLTARLALTLLLTLWAARPWLPRRLETALFALVGGLLLATISAAGHAGAMGAAPFAGDLVHLAATALWAGALVYLAWLPLWLEPAALLKAVRRVSAIGAWSVGALMATGLYLSLIHLASPEALVETRYGRTLSVKLLLVLAVLALAALNRWVFVPLLLRDHRSRPLRRAVRLESLLLAGVLVATGALSTTAPPHEHATEDPHAHPPRAEAVAPPNRLELADNVLWVAAGAEEGLVLRLEGAREARLSLEAVAPDGSRPSLLGEALFETVLEPASDLALPWPSDAEGSWRLSGRLGGDAFELPVLVRRTQAASDLALTLLFIPAPGAGAARTQVYVRVTQGGEVVTPAVSLSAWRAEPDTPPVRHAAAPPRQERPGLAPSTRLNLPAAGHYDLAVTVAGERLSLPLEVPAE